MIVLKIKYGERGEKADSFGMRFYGDIDVKAERLGKISKIQSDPDTPAIINNKRIAVWFAFGSIRPCKDVSGLLSDLMMRLKEMECEILSSSLDDLVDTTSPEYSGKPESRFPPYERMIHGYNATNGFSVTAERKDQKSNKVSIAEIEKVEKIVIEFSRKVYGRSLKKVSH